MRFVSPTPPSDCPYVDGVKSVDPLLTSVTEYGGGGVTVLGNLKDCKSDLSSTSRSTEEGGSGDVKRDDRSEYVPVGDCGGARDNPSTEGASPFVGLKAVEANVVTLAKGDVGMIREEGDGDGGTNIEDAEDDE